MTQEAKLQALIEEILKAPKAQTEIVQEKAFAREQLIARLTALFAISSERASKKARKRDGGVPARQRWFAISSSLAHTLARLVTDLQYEKIRLDVDEARKGMIEGHVPGPGRTEHQSLDRAGEDPEGEPKT
jgi:hypothetical protein